MVRRAAATAVLLLGTLAGCDLDGATKSAPVRPTAMPSAAPTPAPDRTTTPEASPDVPRTADGARRLLRTARNALARARHGGFTSHFYVGDHAHHLGLDYEGRYDLLRLRSDWSLVMKLTDTQVEFQAKSTRDDSWVSLTEVDGTVPDECWIHRTPEALSELFDTEIGDPTGLGFPPQVSALFSMRATGFRSTSDLNVTADLYTVASTFLGQMPDQLGIPYTSRATVPAVVHLVDDAIAGWTVELADVVAAADDAGFLPRSIRRLVRTGQDAQYRGPLDVTLDRTGRPWSLTPPPPTHVVEMSPDADAFETAMRVCTGLGQSTA